MQDLKGRTKAFALDVLSLCTKLPKEVEINIVRRQLARSATSTAANYRAACRAKSDKDFIHKLKICEEECDESAFWMEIIRDKNWESNAVHILLKECDELLAMIVSSIKTKRKNMTKMQ